MQRSQEIFLEALETICHLDNTYPKNPQIKRLYFLLYQLGKQEKFID